MEHTGTFVNNFLNTRKLSTHNLGKLFRLILFLFFSFVLFQNKAFAQSFTVSSPSITEGATGTTNATVVVSLSSAAPEGGKKFFYNVVAETAIAGVDYTAPVANASMTIPEGSTWASISIPIFGDYVAESDETFKVEVYEVVETITNGFFTNYTTVSGDQFPDNWTVNEPQSSAQIQIGFSSNKVIFNGAGSYTGSYLEQSLTGIPVGQTLDFSYDLSSQGSGGCPKIKIEAIDTATSTTFFTQTDSNHTTINGQFTSTVGAFDIRITDASTCNMNSQDTIIDNFSITYTNPTPVISTVTITNDDSNAFTLSSPTITEGDSGTSNASINITLNTQAPEGGARFYYTVVDGTAIAGDDYIAPAANASVVIPEGSTTATISISVVSDNITEPNEAFSVRVFRDLILNSNIEENTKAWSNLPGTSTCSGNPYSLETNSEGNFGGSGSNRALEIDCISKGYQDFATVAGTTYDVSFLYSRRTNYGAVPNPVDVRLTITDLTSTSVVADEVESSSNTSFNFASRTFSFTATGTTSRLQFETTNTNNGGMILDDISIKPQTADVTSTITITNDDSKGFTLSSPTIVEGDSGTNNVDVTVTLNKVAPAGGATLYYSAVSSTAVAVNDYIDPAANASIVIPAGSTSGTISIPIVGDLLQEPEETFSINVSRDLVINPGFEEGSTAWVTLPGASPCMSSYSFELNTEGSFGGSGSNKVLEVDCESQGYQDVETVLGVQYDVSFLHSRRTGSSSVPNPVDIKVVVSNNNAGTLTELNSLTETRTNTSFNFIESTFSFTATGSVTRILFTTTNTSSRWGIIIDDLSVKPKVSDETTTITITDQDTGFSIAATDAVKDEGDSGNTYYTFTVTRSGNITGTSSVNYAVTGSGADAADADDFDLVTLPSGTLNFAVSETSQVITVKVNGDTDGEPDEGFTVTLDTPVGATIDPATATATGTISNDDTSVSIAATNAILNEGDSGNTAYTFTVTR